MTRRELREHTFRQLFTGEFYSGDTDGRTQQMELYFTHVPGDGLDYPPADTTQEDRAEIREKVLAVYGRIPEIDKILEETSVGWTTERMSRVDLSILRLGVYELLFDDSIPEGVAINEAVLLAKKFGGDESYSFINGILGKLLRLREGNKQ